MFYDPTADCWIDVTSSGGVLYIDASDCDLGSGGDSSTDGGSGGGNTNYGPWTFHNTGNGCIITRGYTDSNGQPQYQSVPVPCDSYGYDYNGTDTTDSETGSGSTDGNYDPLHDPYDPGNNDGGGTTTGSDNPPNGEEEEEEDADAVGVIPNSPEYLREKDFKRTKLNAEQKACLLSLSDNSQSAIFAFLELQYLNQDILSEEYPLDAVDFAISIINGFCNGNEDLVNDIIDAEIDGSLISAFPFVKYPVELADEYKTNYPNLTEYLKNELPNLAEDTTIVTALEQYGNLTQNQIEDALKWGNGPTIKLTPLSSTHVITGRFNGLPLGEPGAIEGPDVIELNSYTFENVEQQLQNGSEFNSSTLKFLIAIVILHEMTHYGDFHFNGSMFNSNGEPGFDFETFIFGTTIDYPEDLGIVQEYLLNKQN